MSTGRRSEGRTSTPGRSGGPGRQPALPPPPACKPLPPAPRTPKEMLQAADVAFRKDVRELRARRRRLYDDILQYRYGVGRVAARIVDGAKTAPHDRYYGSATVADTARALDEHLRTVYQCIAFYKATSPEELETLKRQERSWRDISTRLTVRDDEARTALDQRYEAGEFDTSDDLRRAVVKTNAELRKRKGKTDKRARPGDAQALSMIRSFNTMSESVCKVVTRAIEAVEIYVQKKDIMSAATRESLEAEIRESMPNVRAAEKMLFQMGKVIGDFEAMFPQLAADNGVQDEGQGEAVQQEQAP